MKSLIYGYGETGKSFERYLKKQNRNFDIFDNWSKQSLKYNAKNVKRHWDGFNSPNFDKYKKSLGINSLIYWCKESGCNNVFPSNNLENIVSSNIKSEGLIKGVVQVPSDGNPIIMLADHGTIGGYPKIANVISADFDKVAQLTPGSLIKFKEVSLKEAERLFQLYLLETKNIISQIL